MGWRTTLWLCGGAFWALESLKSVAFANILLSDTAHFNRDDNSTGRKEKGAVADAGASTGSAWDIQRAEKPAAFSSKGVAALPLSSWGRPRIARTVISTYTARR